MGKKEQDCPSCPHGLRQHAARPHGCTYEEEDGSICPCPVTYLELHEHMRKTGRPWKDSDKW